MPEEDKTLENENVGGDEDLAPQIARSIAKKAGEQVTCRRVTRHHYRCNWWAMENTSAYDNPGMNGLMVTTSRICQSQFIHAEKVGGSLKIRVVTR